VRRISVTASAAIIIIAIAAVSAQPPPTADAASNAAGSAQTARQRLRAAAPRIARNLRENVVPFWFPRGVDKARGGYTVHYGPKGEELPGGTKMIVTQARQLWLASRLMRSTHGRAAAAAAKETIDLREAADVGFRFLRDRMWDRTNGGFYWDVDPTGEEVRRPHKHLYGQAFGLYALSEYYLATKNTEALDLAHKLFALIEAKAWDREQGGYREFFARDWSAPPADVQPYLGGSPDHKLMNTHLHLLEALTWYVHAGGGALAKERLADLITIQTQTVVRKSWGACTDRYQRDWTPLLDPPNARVSYGHDLENIWLVVDALRALDRPTAPYHDLFRELFAYAMTHGDDRANGGFFDSGPPQQPADRRAKVWWVQAEALVSALTMFQLTGDPRYADVFERTWAWIDTKQTDWTSGEWFETIQPDGTPRAGNKAHQWKAGYHNGRALIEVLERIESLEKATR
jgi:mannose/cellobiose epimerase-like protein (N-acyl-D-glucosamine 2-epimerase family)